MKFINVNERVPVIGDYYYCKVDTKQDCIIKTVVEFAKFPNRNYDWDLKNVTHFNEFGEDAEVVEWLDETEQTVTPRQFVDKIWETEDFDENRLRDFTISLSSAIGMIEKYQFVTDAAK